MPRAISRNAEEHFELSVDISVADLRVRNILTYTMFPRRRTYFNGRRSRMGMVAYSDISYAVFTYGSSEGIQQVTRRDIRSQLN